MDLGPDRHSLPVQFPPVREGGRIDLTVGRILAWVRHVHPGFRLWSFGGLKSLTRRERPHAENADRSGAPSGACHSSLPVVSPGRPALQHSGRTASTSLCGAHSRDPGQSRKWSDVAGRIGVFLRFPDRHTDTSDFHATQVWKPLAEARPIPPHSRAQCASGQTATGPPTSP